MANWTKEEVAELKILLTLGMDTESIARSMSKTVSSITNKKYRLETEKVCDIRNQWTLKEEKYLISSRENGIPFSEIAKHLDRTKSSVENMAARLGAVNLKQKVPQKTKLYLIYFLDLDVYKIGITTQSTIKKRWSTGSNYKVIDIEYFEYKEDALQKERTIKSKVELVEPKKFLNISGFTEMFRSKKKISSIKDLLNEDRVN